MKFGRKAKYRHSKYLQGEEAKIQRSETRILRKEGKEKMLSVTYRSKTYKKAVQSDPGFSPARKPFPRVLQVWVYIRMCTT